jgi:hypothetical protein
VRRDPMTVPASGKPDCPAGSVGQPAVLTQAVLRRELEKAESLARAGAHDAAAEVLFRLLHVYPNPEELLMLIQQSLPEPVYAGIIRRLQREVRRAAVSTPGGRRPADRSPPHTHTHLTPLPPSGHGRGGGCGRWGRGWGARRRRLGSVVVKGWTCAHAQHTMHACRHAHPLAAAGPSRPTATKQLYRSGGVTAGRTAS